jgi:ribonuclease BN (tRNA processing enzyme)
MSLEFTVLGSGSAAASNGKAVRCPSAYAARAGGSLILFDLGPGAVRQLARAGLELRDATDVFLTHLHPDHCADLVALLHALHDRRGPRAGLLRVWGPAGTRELVARLGAAWEPWLDPRGCALEVRELADAGEVQGADWVVETRAVPHTAPALAYRLSRNSSSLVYSGDMEYDAGFPSFAAACDLLVIECAADEDGSLPGHLSPRQALALARASRAGKTLLTHLSDRSAAAAERLIRGDPCVALARDLMRRRI